LCVIRGSDYGGAALHILWFKLKFFPPPPRRKNQALSNASKTITIGFKLKELLTKQNEYR